MRDDKTDFTQGSILKKLSWFMLPVLGALVLQAAYGAVDLLVVGRFGTTTGLSGVSTGSQVLNLVTFVVTQLAMGITVLIARYLGEKKPDLIGPVIGGAAVFALVMLQGDVLAGIFTTDADVVANAYAYLKGFAPETLATAILFTMLGYFNGNGKTLFVMAQGLIQTLLVRLPMAYFMSIQPNASLTNIGLAAPTSTVVGVCLSIGCYLYMNRSRARQQA